MLRLKKLQILGFKSFCDRTEISLPGEGIAAIVGPNGCGKSNISDALSWVLGEQSAKSLRGGKMEDVIFAGTRERKPTGMAEVSITLIDPSVYDGTLVMDSESTPEIVVDDEAPLLAADADWDEQQLRQARAQETETITNELQPGTILEADEDPPEDVAGNDHSLENSVVLKIRRRKFSRTAARAGEIVVTRRLFRTGDSEYLLNGKLCRLRDIQDIFMGTGLGPESYAIIEQERIGQLLSSKPHDRRAIIEEAAGITRFKTKKRLAELRLEAAKQNLARIHDIFEEVTRQINSLKRQAAKAERYASLRDELKAKLRIVLVSKIHWMDEERMETGSSLTSLQHELTGQINAIQKMEEENTLATTRGYGLDAAAREKAAAASQAAVELERTEARHSANEERIAELTARNAARAAEIAQEKHQVAQLAVERQQHSSFLESAAAETTACRIETERELTNAREAIAAVHRSESQMEEQRRLDLDLLTRQGQWRNHLGQAEERLAALLQNRERLEQETARARTELNNLGSERGQISIAFESAAAQLRHLEEEVSGLRMQIDDCRQRENATKLLLDQTRTEWASLEGRRQSLDALLHEHGYSTDTVRNLFRAGALSGFKTVGTLADFLEVDGQYENVVDEYLRDELNYIVVKTWDAADEGMRLLRTGVDGRATFLVHPEDSQAKFSFAAAADGPSSSNQEGVVRLKDKIRVLNGFGRSLEVILPKLRDGYVTPDAGVARTLALENPDAFFLSPSGECFHNVTVTGGTPRSEGPLSLKRELRDTQTRLESIAAEIAQLETTAALLSREIFDKTARLDRLQNERRDAERDSANNDATLRQVDAEVQRLERRLEEWSIEIERNREARELCREAILKSGAELETIESDRQRVEERLTELQTAIVELRLHRDQAQQRSADFQMRLAGLEERRRGAVAQHERIARLHDDTHARLQQSEAHLVAGEAERAHRENENRQLAEQSSHWAHMRAACEAEAEHLSAEAASLRILLTEQDRELKAVRQQADALRERRSELASNAARLTAEIEHLEATALQELGMEPSSLRESEQDSSLRGDEWLAEDASCKAMRQRLEAMGPVNLMALEEFAEASERHTFLETQRNDLFSSIENTQATIKEIDEVSRIKFDQAFAQINANFGRTFTKLFGGGQAFMSLTDEENSAESGVDIVASPPGKKLQNMLLLSGGEKALTALSLLVGIFQYQPSPFCVLDEVDAPLDETNVGRFALLIRELSEQTQFVIITHSKRTMQEAGTIYGVTMQEPGVSKIVSVKLGQQNNNLNRRASA